MSTPLEVYSFSTRQAHKRGFTLVELSIVLVVIGLLVGGVLVGQSMIKNARLQSFMNDLASYNSAATTFQIKYDCVPGDCSGVIKNKFGLPVNPVNGRGAGDMDGLIDGRYDSGSGWWWHDGGDWWNGSGAEMSDFWLQLAFSGLIKEPFHLIMQGDGLCYWDWFGNTRGRIMPTVMETSMLLATSIDEKNYYRTGFRDTSTHPCNGRTGDFALSFEPSGAQYIDAKLDDELPNSGSVRAYGISQNDRNAGALGAANAFCMDVAMTQYNVAHGNPQCGLLIEAGF